MRQICFLTSLLVLLAAIAGAAPSNEPINLSADSLVLDQESGLYRAEGDVVISQGDVRLTAAKADWDQQKGEVSGAGGIRLESPDGLLTGDALTYDFTTGLGLLQNGEAELAAKSVFLSGEKIEKRGEISYRIANGSFTTCPGEIPDWKMTAAQLDVDIEGYSRAKHAIFYVRDIPVLYLPYIALPAKTVRQSGLLYPEYSNSDRLGDRYIQPYYHVIDDNLDATLELDYMSDFGVGTGLEFRYLFRNSRPGRLYGNYITGLDDEPDRALVEWGHDGYLPGKVRLAADVEYVNKKDYFNIFGGNADVYASEKSQSTVYLSRSWNKKVLAAQAQYTRDLEQSSATILQYLPEVRFNYLPQRVGDSPLFLDFLGESSYLWQRQGLKGVRTRLQPTLSTDYLVGKYLEVVPKVTWLQRDYRFDGDNEGEGIPVTTITAGSRLTRVFAVGGKTVTHMRHAVEPILRYLYIPKVDQSHLPQLDGLDRIDPQNNLTFELMNRFTVRMQETGERPRYREVASLRLAVDYDIREERRTLGSPPDKNRPFSPVRGELILRPTENSFLRGDIAYDANSNVEDVESWDAWGGFHDRRGNGLMVNYKYRRDDYDYLSGGVDLALLNPVYVGYEQRYDVETEVKIEEIAQLEYRGKCWSILVSYQDRPGEEKISFEFSLSGISSNQLIDKVTHPVRNFF